jgi:hypothetical protein
MTNNASHSLPAGRVQICFGGQHHLMTCGIFVMLTATLGFISKNTLAAILHASQGSDAMILPAQQLR